MLSRRHMLAFGAGATAMSLAGFPVAWARAATDNRLVIVILRGALDGLAAAPPYFERDYAALRGALALAGPDASDGALDLDGRFGLHPALAPLHEMYRAGEMALVHAVATPYRSRSHFDGQDLLESGGETPHGAADGWLNRAVALLGGGDTSRLGLAAGQSVPLILRGPAPVASWAPAALPAAEPDFLDRLAALYAQDKVLGPALTEGRRVQAMSDDVLGGGIDGGRGASALRPTAAAIGKLLAAAEGPRIATLEVNGWDTHAAQGVLTGRLAGAMRNFADGMDALKTALGATWRRTLVVAVTEFGRTVAVNGTGGTDHGTAGVAFVMGGAVAGGRVLGRWPGLNAGQLYEGRDLAPTTDLRQVFKAALTQHVGLPADALERVVFPDSGNAPALRDLLRA